jgi:signal peptidase II
MRRNRRPPGRRAHSHQWLYLATAASGALVDQCGKLWAVARFGDGSTLAAGPVGFEVSRNPGAAFGMGRGLTPWITALTLAAVVVLLVAGRRAHSRGRAFALGLVTAGAAGNGIDRLFRSPGAGRGAVVDWLHVSPYPPVFNLADVALRVGVLLVLIGAAVKAR